MLNYTDRVRLLMEDIVRRVPALSFVDMREVLVFGRMGRASAHGAYATCHSLTVPDSEPAYYYWRDRRTGRSGPGRPPRAARSDPGGDR